VTDALGHYRYVLDGGAAPGGSPLVRGPNGQPAARIHRAAIKDPLAFEFPGEQDARAVFGSRQVVAYPVADGDVLVVPGTDAWVVCGTAMVPVSSFYGNHGLPGDGGRYDRSVHLAREVLAATAPGASNTSAATQRLGFPAKVSPAPPGPSTRTATAPTAAQAARARQGPAA
jgi:hypothetical protein